jgi:hypothetical protein
MATIPLKQKIASAKQAHKNNQKKLIRAENRNVFFTCARNSSKPLDGLAFYAFLNI